MQQNKYAPSISRDKNWYHSSGKQFSNMDEGLYSTLVHCWWEYKLVQPLCKTAWRPLKIKNRKTIWSSNSTTEYLSKENKNTNLKRHTRPYVYCSIIYNRQDMEATQVSTDRWMDKENTVCIGVCVWVHTQTHTHTHTHTHTLWKISHRKRQNLSICNNMGGCRGYNAKWNKAARDKYHMISLKCRI